MSVNPTPAIGALEPLDLRALPDEVFAQVNPFAATDSGEPDARMRVGELARQAGVAVGNIKFYVREGLLPPGEATAKTQALYGPDHLRRLRTIRVLTEIGGLSLAQVRDVLSAIEAEEDAQELSRVVSYAVGAAQRGAGAPGRRARATEPDDTLSDARARTDAYVDALGLEVDVDAPARAQLAEALVALETLGPSVDPLVFAEHARLAYELAQFEIAAIDLGVHSGGETDGARAAEQVVIGSMAFGAAFMALRAMAHEHEVRRRFSGAEPQPPANECAPFAPPQGSP